MLISSQTPLVMYSVILVWDIAQVVTPQVSSLTKMRLEDSLVFLL